MRQKWRHREHIFVVMKNISVNGRDLTNLRINLPVAVVCSTLLLFSIMQNTMQKTWACDSLWIDDGCFRYCVGLQD